MMPAGDIKTQGIGFANSAGTLPDVVASTQLPVISVSGVLTPAQIQQQVNQSYATSAAKLASDQQQLISDLTGRGFSANSPILFALNTSLAGQSLRGALAAETDLRLNAAKLNADAVFASQSKLSDQFIQQEGVLNDKDRNDVTRVVGVLNAVSGMIGSAL